ncbi:MAG TPA: group 1 glycosyl transferase [Deltaproteobacteria bacterium]|nr:group 1 glycosyl transferase [Deltaproteobacteria bacterium]HQB38733.1 group 1 glycosyl transferase [Deltaproteobacteria bacterium]
MLRKQLQAYLDVGDMESAVEFIRQAVREQRDLEGVHVNMAAILLLSAHWNDIDALLVNGTNTLSTSGWLNSMQKRRPVNFADEPIPWYTYPAIDFLDDLTMENWCVFEWGSGNSTRWWGARVKSIVSIEDNLDWYREVKEQIPSNVRLYYMENPEYHECILAYQQHSFDAIIIDGSCRNQAALNSIGRLRPNGIIIFDNSDNPEFNSSQQTLCEAGFYRIDFWGMIPSFPYKNCTSIYFRNPELLRKNTAPFLHRASAGLSCQQALNSEFLLNG